MQHIFLSGFHSYSLLFPNQWPQPSSQHPCGLCCPRWRMVVWCADLHLTFGSGGILGVWMTRGWHLYILEDIFTPKRCWRLPRRHRPKPRSMWPDFSPLCFWQTSPGIHRNAFRQTRDRMKTLVPPVCCRWCHQRLDPALHRSHSVWQAG